MTVSDELVESTGARFDYPAAMRGLSEMISRRGPVVLQHESMAGSYLGTRAARRYLQGQTIFHPTALASVYDGHQQSNALRVVLHVRAGDFALSEAEPSPGCLTSKIPSEWYERIGRAIRAGFDRPVEMTVLSDNDSPEIAGLRRSVGAPVQVPQSSLVDLALMAHADLLVCSLSGFIRLRRSPDSPISGSPHTLGCERATATSGGHEQLQRTDPP